MKESRSKSVLGGEHKKKSEKKSSKSHKPDSIHVKKGKSGGYIATHHFHHKPGEEPQESEDHVLPDQQAMLDHMEQNLPEEQGEMAQGGGEPQGAAPAQAAPAAAQAGM
jgi:hypothetical protein